MTDITIAFIGAGNMAGSMIGGLICSDYPKQRIIACDKDPHRLQQVHDEYGVQGGNDCNEAVQNADIVILAVKPQVMQTVCESITATAHRPLFISIAAGLRESDINHWLGGGHAMVRCMPNTPALVGLGATGLYANDAVSAEQKQRAESIMQTIGLNVWVDDEAKLDAVTAISGSGPAYFFLFIEALEQAARELGLDADSAFKLSRQTALGAATMALHEDVVKLRAQVTSPGGTTEQAIASFQRDGLQRIVSEATRAARERSVELSEILANNN